MGFLRKIKTKYLIVIVIALSFLFVFFLPTSGEVNETINSILGMTGLLFGILVGFFITDLYSRFQRIRANVAIEVSGLQTYYLFVKILDGFPKQREWVKKEQELIDKYVCKFFEVEWDDYGKLDPYFNAIIESLAEVKELETVKEDETYANLLPLLNQITTAREKLYMDGKDKLGKMEWLVILSLAATLIFCIFLVRVPVLPSLLLSVTLISAVATLVLMVRDLNNLNFGEEAISFEPYETIFDVIGKPRFYLKRDIEGGRVVPPKDIDYRIGE